MKKIVFAFAVLYSVIFLNCSSLETIKNEELEAKLIGTWHSKDFETIQFNEDNTFVDTVFTKLPFVGNYYIPNYILAGKFYVEDNLIKFKEVSLIYSREIIEKNVERKIIPVYPKKVYFEDDGFFMQNVRSLKPAGDFNKMLKGIWEETNWVCTYHRNSKKEYNDGLTRETYNFYPETNLCKYSRNFLFDNTFKGKTIISVYYYNPTYLNIESVTNVQVAFDENKMIWFYKDPAFFEKVN